MNIFRKSGSAIAIIALLAANGCTGKSGSSEQTNSPATLEDSLRQSVEINSDQSELFQTIIGQNTEGIFRGVRFGDRSDAIKKAESFELIEDTATHLLFSYDTPQHETIDIMYAYDANEKIAAKIIVDVYLNSLHSTQKLWEECIRHFDNAYGAGKKSTTKQHVWKTQGLKLTLDNVSKDVDYGLRLEFEPASGKLMAAR